MLIFTGKAVLRINEDTDKKYWEVSDQYNQDVVDLEDGECIELNPNSFEEGTVISREEFLARGLGESI